MKLLDPQPHSLKTQGTSVVDDSSGISKAVLFSLLPL